MILTSRLEVFAEKVKQNPEKKKKSVAGLGKLLGSFLGRLLDCEVCLYTVRVEEKTQKYPKCLIWTYREYRKTG